jgi:tripartite ATP-independent transporter DctM subunit
MEWYYQGLIVAAAILGLLAIRMSLGFVFGVVAAGGILITTGRFNVLTALSQSLHDMLSDFVLITIPLFVLMAEVLSAAGFIPDLYTSVEKWTGRLRGSLSVATIIASAVFAAVCGSSYVTAASLGRMTMPEMLARGYKKHLAAGSVAAGGSLGIPIPPSLAFVIYGYMSGASIAALFIAGIIPGVILCTLFILCVIGLTKLFPDIAGTGVRVSMREKIRTSIKFIPIFALAIMLLGSIYLGVATPAEAAAVGCIFSVFLCWVYRKLSWQLLLEGARRALATSGFLLLLMGTAKVLGFMMAKAGIMYGIQEVLSALPKWSFLLVLYFTVALLGLFLEGTSIIVLTTPIFAPAVSAIGLDLIWYGVILVLFIEIALLTPPVGMNCYIVAEVSKSFGVRLEDVFRGIGVFLVALLVAVLLVTFLPDLALWLPSTMH